MNFLQWDDVQLITFFHILVRVTTFTMLLPVLGDKALPTIVKILFGFSIACVLHPMLWGQGLRVPQEIMNSPNQLAGSVISEVIFGAFVGFIARWVFDAVQFAGHFAGTSMGFSMASVFDPHTETQTISYAELQYVMTVLLFLALDGHHMYIKSLVDSFSSVPLASPKILTVNQSVFEYLLHMSSEVLSLGFKLSAPIVVVIFLINMTFGILARAVPQLNVLVVSFASNIIIGLFIGLISIPSFMGMVDSAFDTYQSEIHNFIRLFGK